MTINEATEAKSESWRSPLSQPIVINSTDESISGAFQQHGIPITKDGWFGFCFGFEREEKQKEGIGSHWIYVQNERARNRVPLPFTHKASEKANAKQEPLICLDFGKLVFLKKHSRVLVAQHNSSPIGSEESSHLSENKPSNSKQPKWQLVATDKKPSESPTEPPGTPRAEDASFEMSDSRLICSTCKRAIGSIHGVLCHALDAHPRVVDPMWSTSLTVVYEDEHMGAIIKPQGMPVMGASPSLCRSDLLMVLKSSKPGGVSKPIPVHRLDSLTGGLLVVAKTKVAEIQLKECFAKRTCRKRYLALVVGKLEPSEGLCNSPMGGKEAITRYKIVRHTRCVDHGWVSVVDLHPITGRRHQLRKHMKTLGHPIWGDPRYGSVKDDEIHSRLCLWHMEINLPHPLFGHHITLSMDEPEWLSHVVQVEEDRWSQAERSEKDC
jgi:23S rRNA pseudouridine1911/1915/1917 synthase